MKQIEAKLGGEIEEILRVMYVDECLPVQSMSESLGISYVTTLNWLKLAGIRSRKIRVDYEK